jgi:hypothetical protein
MSMVDVSSLSNVPLGECDRCKRTYSLAMLQKDINFPGLKVCSDCQDTEDPLRVVARTKFSLDREINVGEPRPMKPLVD